MKFFVWEIQAKFWEISQFIIRRIFEKRNKNFRNNTISNDSKKRNYFYENLVNKSQKNYDLNNIDTYNYYKKGNSMKNSLLNSNINTFNSIDVNSKNNTNNYNDKYRLNDFSFLNSNDYSNINNLKFYGLYN